MYKDIKVNTYGTEWDFISNLISQIESCGIQCMTNKEELQSAMESKAASVIPIVFQYRNFQFVLKRLNNYSSSSNSYNFYLVHNDTELFKSSVVFSASNFNCDVVVTRKMSLTILTNENHMEVLVYNYNNAFCAEVFFTEICGEVCHAYSNSSSTLALNSNIIGIESKTIYTAVNSMPFKHNETGKLFYISEKMFSNNGVYVASDNGLLDCTSVIPKTFVTINNKIYYALTANTLIEV